MSPVPSSLRIGIVDDQEVVTMVLKAILQALGHTATVAHTHAEGMALAGQPDAFDVMFVDLALDGSTSGVDIARRAADAGVQVVIMTGSPQLPDGLSGMARLPKPFTAGHVQAALQALRPAAIRD